MGLVVTPQEPSDGPRRSRGAFAPLELLDDVQREALDAAMRIAAEMAAMGDATGVRAWFDRAEPGADGAAADSGSARIDIGRLRRDVTRAADTFSDLVQAILDVGFDALEEMARRNPPRGATRVAPGAVAELSCVLHQDGDAPASVRPRLDRLVQSDGTELVGTTEVAPEVLGLAPGERATITFTVHVGPDAAAGRYHGLVLAEGIPDFAHPVTIDVEAATVTEP
jgi:hypothetical protein